jgi:pimeloyl-ACP methyl ester carboxylesterase
MIATTTSTGHASDDPVLLLMTGWCDDRAQLDALLAATGRTRRTVSMDWRGHGGSSPASGDFGTDDLVADALRVVEEVGAERVVPVAVSHAGWVAIELRRRLGERVPGLVLIDWMVLGPPPGFAGALAGLQDPDAWSAVRDQLFAMWTDGVDHPDVLHSVRRMAGHGREMWARAGREIARSFEEHGAPVDVLRGLGCPVLHLYAQPRDPAYLDAQQALAAAEPWFDVRRLDARSHFPMLEVPDEMAEAIEAHVGRLPDPVS